MRWLALVVACVAACGYAPGSILDASHGDGMGSDSASGSDGSTGSDSGLGSDSGCIDVDHDSICDAVDDWLCGPTRPAAPANPDYILGLSNVANVNLGSGNAFATTAPGGTTMFVYAYGIQAPCPGSSGVCNAQIEFGIAGIGRNGCLFDGTIKSGVFEGLTNQHASITAPATPGLYEVRAKVATSMQCGAGSGWFGGTEPPSGNTFAYICVPG